MNEKDQIIQIVLKHYPDTQAIYLFGSYGTDDELKESDADIAVLLECGKAKEVGSLVTSELCGELRALLGRDVDLINLRRVATVLQKEVVAADRRIYEGDKYAADEFDMLTLSYYQKLNEERAGILKAIMENGRIYDP